MTQIHPRDSQRPEFEANSTGQMISHGEIKSLSSNKPLHTFGLVIPKGLIAAYTTRIMLDI
jgi:hypothetical protein